MHILMLAQFYSPAVGGEERHVQDLSHELVKRGHKITVASIWHPGQPEFEEDQGVRVFRLHSTTGRTARIYSETERMHAPPFPDPELTAGLWKLIEHEQPDIIHAHNWMLHSYLPYRMLKKIPTVVTLHDYSYSCANKRLMYHESPCSGPGLLKCMGCSIEHYGPLKGAPIVAGNEMMKLVERRVVDMFIAVSQTTAAGNGLPGSGLPYRIIPNFIPDDVVENPESADSLATRLPEDGYLLFVGDLSLDKGIQTLIAAYGELKDVPPLVLIGRKTHSTPENFPPNVYYMGRWPHAAVLEAWRHCSIALTPSVWPEPFGIVAIEAMSSGHPIIASCAGGLSDLIVDGESGYLVQPGDTEELKSAIQRLLADPSRQQKMGQAAKERAALFKASSVIPQIEQLYVSLINPGEVFGPADTNEQSESKQPGKKKTFLTRSFEHMRSPLFFNGYALTVSSAATSVIGVLYWLLAARFYPPEIVGQNSAAIAMVLFLSGIATISLDVTLVRFIPRAGPQTRRLIGIVYILSMLVALIVAPVFLAGLNLWSPVLSFLRSSTGFIILFILAILTGSIFIEEDGALTGLRQAKWVAVENSIYSVIKLGLLIFFAAVLPQYGILFSWILPILIIIPAVNYFIFRRFAPAHANNTRDISETLDSQHIIKYTASNYLGYLFYLAYTMLPTLMVIQVAGSKANAYFYLPWVIAGSLRLLTANMGTSLTVEGSLQQAKLVEYFRQVLRNTILLLVPAVLVLAIGAPILLSLFGHNYASEGSGLLRWLAFATIPNTLVALYLAVLRLQNRYGAIVLVQGVFAVMSLGLIYFLLPVLGITGVGVAWMISQSLLALFILLREFGLFLQKPEVPFFIRKEKN